MASACRPIPTMPIIMVGPGTGIAPFRAFLHERMATKAPGRNWLFFGHQRRDCDFFYEDELTGMKAAGVLTRLSLAWSRDGDEKFYVQDRMREVGRDLWAWLADGAHIYVCGDAKRMAKDVERALVDIVAQHGARSTDEAVAFVAELKKAGRYQTGRVLMHERAASQLAPPSRTTCPYCGVGCGVLARPDGSGGAIIAGDPDHPANFGRLCSKGSRSARRWGSTAGCCIRCCGSRRQRSRASIGTTRSTTVADGFRRIVERDGPDAVAFYLSGQLLTEDYYVANKLMKGFIGSANVDTNSRLCMASSVAGHRRAFGADTVPGSYEDLDEADLIVLVGSNAAWCHPVLFQRMMRNRRERGAKIVVIDPRRTATARRCRPVPADRAGHGHGAVLRACWCISPIIGALDHDLHRRAHDRLRRGAGARARDRAGHRRDRARRPASTKATSRASSSCSAPTRSAVTCYLAGREPVGAGHRQGQRHHQLPSRHRPHRQAGHGAVLADRPAQRDGRPRGRRARQPARRAHGLRAGRDRSRAALLERAAHGRARRPQGRADVRGDRARRDQGAVGDGDQSGGVAAARRRRARGAEQARAVRRLRERRCATTPSMPAPHVLLPAAAWGEKDGTVTNSERRISRQRAFLPLPGEAKPDWWIVAEVARRMGFARRVRLSLARPTCSASTRRCRRSRTTARATSISAGSPRSSDERLRRARAGAMAGARRRRRQRRALLRRRRLLHARPQGALHRAGAAGAARRRPAPNFPLRLNTGRVRDQWHTMTRTGPEPAARRAPAGAVRRSPSASTPRRYGLDRRRLRARRTRARRLRAQGRASATASSAARSSRRSTGATTTRRRRASAIWSRRRPIRSPASRRRRRRRPRSRRSTFAYARLRADARAARAAGRRLVGARRAAEAATGSCSRPTTRRCCVARSRATIFSATRARPNMSIAARPLSRRGLRRRPARRLRCSSARPTRRRGTMKALFEADTPMRRRAVCRASRPTDAGSGPLVCACFGVGVDAIRDALDVARGNSVDEIGSCAARRHQCGSCLPELKRIVP